MAKGDGASEPMDYQRRISTNRHAYMARFRLSKNIMFSYFGSKFSIVDYYPAPREDTIIEPFAGSAAYALRHFEKEVYLYDLYEDLVAVWKWLQQCSKSDILLLPRMVKGERIDDYDWDCKEEQDFMGFIIGYTSATPRKTVSPRGTYRTNFIDYSLNRVANNLWKIKHWKIARESYLDVPNRKATWFIDPPYKKHGKYYKHSSKNINYDQLAKWCRTRNGQVMVCEGEDSGDWLDFKKLKCKKSVKGMTNEYLYTNFPFYYQQELF